MSLSKTSCFDIGIVLFGCLCALPSAFILNNVGLLTTPLVKTFNSTRFEAAWVGSLNNGFTFLLSMVVVALLEKFGFFLPMGIASLLHITCMMVATVVPTLSGIYVLFMVTGLSLCVNTIGYMTIVGEHFTARRARDLAFTTISMSCGIMSPIGSLSTGLVANNYGYRGILYLFGSLGLIAVVAVGVAYFTPVQKRMKTHPERPHDNEDDDDGSNGSDNTKKSSCISGGDVSNERENSGYDKGNKNSQHEMERLLNQNDSIHKGNGCHAGDKSSHDSERQQPLSNRFLTEYTQIFRDERIWVFFAGYTLIHCAFIVTTILAEDMVQVVYGVPLHMSKYVFVSSGCGAFLGKLLAIASSFFSVNKLVLVTVFLACFSFIEAVLPHTSFTFVCLAMGSSGMLFGFMVSTTPSIVLSTFGTEKMARYLGMMYTANGLGAIIGAPIAGFFKDQYSYYEAFYFGGTAMLSGAVLLVILAVHPATRHMHRK